MSHIPTTALVCKAAIEMTYQSETLVNTLWFEKTDEAEWTTDSLEFLLIALEDWWVDEMSTLLANSLTLDRIYASRQENPTSFFAERFPVGAGGTVVGGECPANVAVSVKFASTLMGRNFRGRNYVGGLPLSAVDGSTVDATFKTNLIQAYGLLPGHIASEVNANHVIVSHYANKMARPLAVTVPVAGYAIRKSKVCTMRSRVND